MTQPNGPSKTSGSGAPRDLPRSRLVLVASGPAAIGVVVILGMLVTHSFNLAGYPREMWAAVIISLTAGALAVLPLLLWMGRGLAAIVRLTMLATGLRVVFMLGGLILAAGPGWKLGLIPLAAWTGGCYLALLIAESGATAWVVRHG